MAPVIEFTCSPQEAPSTLKKIIAANREACVLWFFKDTCRPCSEAAPKVRAIAQDSTAQFVRIDVGKHYAIAREWNVDAVPSFVVLGAASQPVVLRGAGPSELAALRGSHLA